jgi:hypothetical protein
LNLQLSSLRLEGQRGGIWCPMHSDSYASLDFFFVVTSLWQCPAPPL